MSSSSTGASPIPKQPVGRTFVAAILVLGLFAALQILAVVNYYLPTVARELTSASQEKAAPVQAAATPQPEQVRPYRPAAPTEDEQKLQFMFNDADKMYRVGQFSEGLEVMNQAAVFSPNNPNVIFRIAQFLERLERYPDSSAAFAEFLRLPNVSPEARKVAAARKRGVDSKLTDTNVKNPVEQTAAEPAAVGAGPAVREDNGLQPGSVLGITDVRIREDKPGFKNLRVAVKSRQGAEISPIDVKIFVYFYEKAADGEIVLTESTPVTQWIGTDVDWKTDEPELLDVEYPMPETGREYYGYVVAVYYNKELQDSQADPGPLAEKFEIPLYLKYEQDAQ